MQKKTVLWFDAHNLFIRCFASLNMTNENGEHVGGLFGSLNSITSVINKFKPSMVVVCWEGKGSSERRRKLLKEYKEGREFKGFNRTFEGTIAEEKKTFWEQLNKLQDTIKDLPFYQLSVDFLEADDVIAYCSNILFKEEDLHNIIISTDRDYYQVVSDSCSIFRPVKTKESSDGVIVDHAHIMEEMGVHPENYIILKCITGDKSDAVDGIKRIGAKTVVKHFPFLCSLKSNGDIYSIEDIIQYCKDTDVAKYQKYLENEKLLKMNFKLMQLLKPDIGLKAIQTIERSFTNNTPKFKETAFRIKLIKSGISPRNISRWVDTYTDIKPDKNKDIIKWEN